MCIISEVQGPARTRRVLNYGLRASTAELLSCTGLTSLCVKPRDPMAILILLDRSHADRYPEA